MPKLHFFITLKPKSEFPVFALLVGNADRVMLWHHQENRCHSQVQRNLKVAGHGRHHCPNWARFAAPHSITALFFRLESGVHACVLGGKWEEL